MEGLESEEQTPGGNIGIAYAGARCGVGGYAVRGEESEDFRFGQIEAESFEGDFEFVVVDSLVLVVVEENELRGLLAHCFDVG